jgi:hypothetical protein
MYADTEEDKQDWVKALEAAILEAPLENGIFEGVDKTQYNYVLYSSLQGLLFFYSTTKHSTGHLVMDDSTDCGFRNLSRLSQPKWGEDDGNFTVTYYQREHTVFGNATPNKSIVLKFNDKSSYNKFKIAIEGAKARQVATAEKDNATISTGYVQHSDRQPLRDSSNTAVGVHSDDDTEKRTRSHSAPLQSIFTRNNTSHTSVDTERRYQQWKNTFKKFGV